MFSLKIQKLKSKNFNVKYLIYNNSNNGGKSITWTRVTRRNARRILTSECTNDELRNERTSVHCFLLNFWTNGRRRFTRALTCLADYEFHMMNFVIVGESISILTSDLMSQKSSIHHKLISFNKSLYLKNQTNKYN